jgi:hypothetical protein
VGGGVLLLNTDYNNTGTGLNKGVTAWADYDFFRFLGVEGEAHFGGIVSPADIIENSYFVGPRATYRFHKASIYGKLMFGRATIAYQPDSGPQKGVNLGVNPNNTAVDYNSYAFGGGVAYRIKPHISIRAIDFELLKYPNFYPHTLSPMAITIGAAYVFH